MTKQNNECQGYYEVSGYTTKDGKKVDSYIRNCWKHGSGISGSGVQNTRDKIEETIKNIESILKQNEIKEENVTKCNTQIQIVIHNILDDLEDLSIEKANLPKIPTVESIEQGQKIEKDRKQFRENAYQTILMLYQQRNVVEKQWKKVSTKDDYDNKFNQYIANKQEIEKLCDTAKDLFDYTSKFDDTIPEKVKKIRDELGLIRLRPMPPKKQVEQQQKWIWPVSIDHIITSGFGNRMHPVKHRLIFHDGIDINAKLNTQVYAVADGKVVMSQWYNGYGNYIEIDHGDGLHSFYGHLNSFNVKVGDYVSQGQIIAKSGNTGIGTGAHLHFGIHKNGQKVNPIDFLPKSQ